MLRISADQFAKLENATRQDFLLQCVCEWSALFRICHDRPSRLGFDIIWITADHVLNEVDGLPQRSSAPVAYTFIHAVLTAVEKGASAAHLRTGVAAFCRALPAEEAGYVLFDTLCAVAAEDSI